MKEKIEALRKMLDQLEGLELSQDVSSRIGGATICLRDALALALYEKTLKEAVHG